MHRFYTALFLLLIIATGCNQKYLDGCSLCGDISMQVVFDWSYAPQGADQVKSMTLWFFPTDGFGEVWRFDLAGAQGGRIRLPKGRYDVIAYNNDVYGVATLGEDSWQNFAMFILTSLHPDTVSHQQSAKTPGAVWADAPRAIEVPGQLVSSDYGGETIYTIVMHPRLLTPRYRYEISDITNLSSIRLAQVSLSNMASQINVSLRQRSGVVTLQPSSSPQMGSGRILGKFYTFGPSVDGGTNMLTLHVTLSDGKQRAYRWDVTQQIASSPDSMDVHLRVGGIELPKVDSIGSAGGLDAIVDGWQIIDIPLVQ